MFYVYRFLDKKKNIIYVGKSKLGLEQRFKAHFHLPKECYEIVRKIEYISCKTESDMMIKEIYYINKYKNEKCFFNILDISDMPSTLEFSDKWKVYKGPLPQQFSNSLNYIKGYSSEKTVKYNKDGSIDRRKSNKESGEPSFVEALTEEEVSLMTEYLIKLINESTNSSQEQIRFRNLLMFILGTNLPLKTNDLLMLKYKDLFDDKNHPKDVEYSLGRFHHDEKIYIPLRKNVVNLLQAYADTYGLTYQNNSEDNLFQSRKHQVVSIRAWWKTLTETTNSIGIDKNVGSESLRKTYGLNVYSKADDKLKALVFLGEIFGNTREVKIINYLGLEKSKIDYSYYFSEYFSLGNINLADLNCLNSYHSIENKKDIAECKASNTHIPHKENERLVKKRIRKRLLKNNRVWTTEEKYEIILPCILCDTPQKIVASKNDIDPSVISRWVKAYKKRGVDGLKDKRINTEKD